MKKFIVLFLILNSCTIPEVNVELWELKQIKDGKITLFDINKDNKHDLIISGYQKGGDIKEKKLILVETDGKRIEVKGNKYQERGYDFYLDSNYQLWVRINGNIEKVNRNLFMSNINCSLDNSGNLVLLENGKRVSVNKNKWEKDNIKIWVDDYSRLWVKEGSKTTLAVKDKWKRTFNVNVLPVKEWVTGTALRRGGLTDDNGIPLGNSVIAIDGKTRKTIWDFETKNEINTYPSINEDKVFFGSNDKNMYCIGLKDGKLKWKFSTLGEIHSTPAIYKDKVFFGTREGIFYCLSANSGNILWAFKANSSIDSSPAIYEDKVFFGSWDKNFYCFDTNGNMIWKQKLNSYISKSSPIVYNEKVVFGCWDKNVYALDIYTGNVDWFFRTDDWIDKGKPAAGLGKVYIGNKEGKIYALDINTGLMKWEFSTSDSVSSSIILSENRLYATSRDGYLYAIEPRTGKFLWEHRNRFKVYSSPAIAKNIVYFSSMGGYLWAIADTGMGKPIWAMYGGDPSHRNSFGIASSYAKDLEKPKTQFDKFLAEYGLDFNFPTGSINKR